MPFLTSCLYSAQSGLARANSWPGAAGAAGAAGADAGASAESRGVLRVPVATVRPALALHPGVRHQ